MSNSLPLYHEALSLYKSGQAGPAIDKLRKVLAETPSFEDAYEALAVIFYNEKRYDDSIAVLRDSIKINPHSIMAHTNLSRCYVAKGMILEAEREQGEARKLTWMAELKEKKQAIPKVDYQAQVERYKQIIALDPADVLGYYSLASTYQEAGKKREAADSFEKAVEVDPKHSASYLGFGIALIELGDKEKAKRIFRKGIQVADSNGDMVPMKKMQAHLNALEESKADSKD